MCLQKTHALKPDEQSVVGSVELILGILARDAIHRESMILRPLTIDAVCGARLLIARVQQSLLKPLDRVALAAPIQQAVARRRASGGRRRTGSRLRRGRIENLLRIGVCRAGYGNTVAALEIANGAIGIAAIVAVNRTGLITQCFQTALKRYDRRAIAVGTGQRDIVARRRTSAEEEYSSCCVA